MHHIYHQHDPTIEGDTYITEKAGKEIPFRHSSCFVKGVLSVFQTTRITTLEVFVVPCFPPTPNNIKRKSRSAPSVASTFISLQPVLSPSPLIKSSGHTRSYRIRFEVRRGRTLFGQNRIWQANRASTAAGGAYRDNAAWRHTRQTVSRRDPSAGAAAHTYPARQASHETLL